MNLICVLHYSLQKNPGNRFNLASKYNMAAIIPLCITKKVLYQQCYFFCVESQHRLSLLVWMFLRYLAWDYDISVCHWRVN